MQLDVEIEGLVDLMAEVGIGAAERQHHADFHRFSLGGSAHCQGQGSAAQPSQEFHLCDPPFYIFELVGNPTNSGPIFRPTLAKSDQFMGRGQLALRHAIPPTNPSFLSSWISEMRTMPRQRRFEQCRLCSTSRWV